MVAMITSRMWHCCLWRNTRIHVCLPYQFLIQLILIVDWDSFFAPFTLHSTFMFTYTATKTITNNHNCCQNVRLYPTGFLSFVEKCTIYDWGETRRMLCLLKSLQTWSDFVTCGEEVGKTKAKLRFLIKLIDEQQLTKIWDV